jgi:hypothetical protein
MARSPNVSTAFLWERARREALEDAGWTIYEGAGGWFGELGTQRAVYGETLAELLRRIGSVGEANGADS